MREPEFFAARRIVGGRVTDDETYVGVCRWKQGVKVCGYAADHADLQQVIDAVHGHIARAHEGEETTGG